MVRKATKSQIITAPDAAPSLRPSMSRRSVSGFFLSFWQNTKRGYNDENQKRAGSLNELYANRTDRSNEPPKETDREIIEQYRPTIDRLCRRYGRDGGAEMESDLMAEALKAHKAAKTARDPAAYVSRSLFNRAFHLYRAGKRQRDFERAAADFSLDAPAGKTGRDTLTPLVECVQDERQLDLAESLELKIRRELVLDSLKRSPRLQEIAAMLMDGLSHAQIARFYGFSHERPRQIESQIVRTVRLELGIDCTPTGRKRRNVHRPL